MRGLLPTVEGAARLKQTGDSLTRKEHMKMAIGLLWLLLFWLPLLAQTATSPQVEGMKKLDFLAGEWKGEGWISFGPGKPHTFTQTETIKAKLGGMKCSIKAF